MQYKEKVNEFNGMQIGGMQLNRAAHTYSRMAEAVKGIDDKNITFIAAKNREAVEEPYVQLFYETLMRMVLENKLSLVDLKVILGVCGVAQFGNLVSLSQEGLAASIQVHAVTVSKSITKLKKVGVLIQTKLGLFINPCILTKGALGKVDPDLWDAALELGFQSRVRSVARKQKKSKITDDMGD